MPSGLHFAWATWLKQLATSVDDQEDDQVAHQHHKQGQQPGQAEHKDEVAKLLKYDWLEMDDFK